MTDSSAESPSQSKLDEWPFALVFAVALVVYGRFVWGEGRVLDQWAMAADPDGMYGWLLAIGRWGQVVLLILAGNNTLAPAVTAPICIALLVLAARQALPLLELPEGARADEKLLFGLLWTLCPLWSSHLAYRSNHLAFGVAVFGATWAVRRLSSTSSEHWMQGGIALMFAVGCQQSAALVFGTLTLFVAARRPRDPLVFTARSAAVGAIATAAALGISFLVRWRLDLLDAPISAYALNLVDSPTAAMQHLQLFARTTLQFYVLHQPLWPVLPKLLVLGLVAIRLAQVWRRNAPASAALRSGLLALGMLAPFLLVGISTSPIPLNYTALAAAGVVVPCLVLPVLGDLRTSLPATLLRVTTAAVVVLFAIGGASAAASLQLLTQHDEALVADLLRRAREASGGDVQQIVLLGRQPPITTPPLSHAIPRDAAHPMADAMTDRGIFSHQPRFFGDALLLLHPGAPEGLSCLTPVDRPAECAPLVSPEALEGLAFTAVWPDAGSVVVQPRSQRVYIVLSEHALDVARQRAAVTSD